MKKFLLYIKKALTHNYCDSCGFTKDRLYVTEYLIEGGIRECNKCITNKQIKNGNKCKN